VPDDAPAIRAIAFHQGLPVRWTLPEGKHILVAGDPVAAFACLLETPYGIVVNELWELPTAAGFRALAALSRRIEEIAQETATRRGEPIQCGGVVRLDRDTHRRALKKRGYAVEAEVLSKMFAP
jgi:hypothetical protein